MIQLKRALERRETLWKDVTEEQSGKIEADGGCYVIFDPFARDTKEDEEVVVFI